MPYPAVGWSSNRSTTPSRIASIGCRRSPIRSLPLCCRRQPSRQSPKSLPYRTGPATGKVIGRTCPVSMTPVLPNGRPAGGSGDATTGADSISGGRVVVVVVSLSARRRRSWSSSRCRRRASWSAARWCSTGRPAAVVQGRWSAPWCWTGRRAAPSSAAGSDGRGGALAGGAVVDGSAGSVVGAAVGSGVVGSGVGVVVGGAHSVELGAAESLGGQSGGAAGAPAPSAKRHASTGSSRATAATAANLRVTPEPRGRRSTRRSCWAPAPRRR